MKIPLNSLTVAKEFTILRPQLVEKSRLILTHLPVSNRLVWYELKAMNADTALGRVGSVDLFGEKLVRVDADGGPD
jgi:hypothetical protein